MRQFRFIFRLIALPLIAALMLIAAVRLWMIWVCTYVRYGGEFIRYTKEISPTTIGEILSNLKPQ